jgi:hypothetical protein
MKTVFAEPPLMAEIDAAFNVKGKAVFFAWGDTVYSPSGKRLPDCLIDHERVHGERQGHDVEGWWRRYIADPRFRLDEEIPAHRAEYRWWARQPGARRPVRGFRSQLQFMENEIAKRLASPLYGSLVTVAEAKRLILAP